VTTAQPMSIWKAPFQPAVSTIFPIPQPDRTVLE